MSDEGRWIVSTLHVRVHRYGGPLNESGVWWSLQSSLRARVYALRKWG